VVKPRELARRGPWTVPNLVTLLRLAMLPPFLYAIAAGRPRAALVLFVVAGISDGLDGYLARVLDMRSAFGAILDPIADKLLLMSSYIMLAVPVYTARVHIPVSLSILVISRDFLLLLVGLLIILTTSIRKFPATPLGKTNTVVQILTVAAVLCADVWPLPMPYLWVPFGATAASTVISGFQYVFRVARRIAKQERREAL
jgi:cardiolipin synthase (CMP-forming)